MCYRLLPSTPLIPLTLLPCTTTTSDHQQHDQQHDQLGHVKVPRYTKGPTPELNLTEAEEVTLKKWNEWDIKVCVVVVVGCEKKVLR